MPDCCESSVPISRLRSRLSNLRCAELVNLPITWRRMHVCFILLLSATPFANGLDIASCCSLCVCKSILSKVSRLFKLSKIVNL